MPTIVNTVTKCDLIAFRWCMSRKRHAEIARLARWISKTGDGYLYALIGVLLLWLDAESGPPFALALLLAFAVELPTYLVSKNTVRRHRPADAIVGFSSFLQPSDKFSFPSGHTAAAFLFANVVAFYYPAYALPAYSAACLIGVSRVLLGVHFPSDIVAGMALGLVSAELALWMLG
ncbi:Type II phosphatidic acid phosphatase [Candidatus Tenderia electrophaga]|jgi:undecaprenyl-diphosphatase|uniref:undecaprenyl-diphosphate phosphatase n=1 Tax=Candidatus Tenderia electrophaga TaxID=1748243 RepID=A0A0S2TD28_9GAMM|nr:Type II phosphatidic acid phosphatase [Candidatus Tenderia electrophaga]